MTWLRKALLVGLLLLAGLVGEAAAADCTAGMAITGDGACTNAQTLTLSSPTQATISATGNLDLTNANVGMVGAGGSAGAVYTGGGLTLNNAGNIVTMSGGSNYTILTNTSQAGVVNITNSGLIGDQAMVNGASSRAITVGNLATTFTLTNTAGAAIRTTGSATGTGVASYAATVTINNAGVIRGGTANGTGIFLTNFTTATVNNSGSINSQSAMGIYGLLVSSAGTLSFNNSGGLWGGTAGLNLLGGVTATITNTGSGTMTGSTSAIDVGNGNATLTNDGTISATAPATYSTRGNITSYNPAINVASGSSLTLTNRGTITAQGAGIKVASGAVSATITNSGTIQATGTPPNVATKISGLYLDNTTSGTTVTNTGTISGTAYGVNLNSGTMTLSNAGTISGGTSAVFLNTGGNTINVNNGAVFTNGIDYNNTTGNTTNFLTTASYSLPVKNYLGASNTVTLGANLSRPDARNVSNGDIVVVYTPPVAAVTPVATPGTINVVNMAAVTNTTAVQSSGYVSNVSGMLGDVMTIGDLGYGAQSPSDDAGPSPSNVLGYVEIIKPKSRPVAAIDAALSKPQTLPAQGQVVDGAGNVVWSRAFAGAQYTPVLNGFSALSSAYFGAAIGLDHRFDTWRLGGYVGGGKASQGVLDGSGDLEGSVYFGGLYAHNDQNDFITDLGLSLGKLSNTSRRYINNGAQTATGSFGGLFVAPEAALGYRFELTDGWTVVPSIKLRYTGSFYDGYTETGSSQNVAYSDQSVHMFEERAQVKLSHTEQSDTGLKQLVYVQGAILGAQRAGDSNLNAAISGNAYTVTSSTDKSLLAASVGAGFDLNLTPSTALYGGADATLYTNGSSAVAGRVGVKLAF